MAKSKPQFHIENYGIYQKWTNKGKGLPKLQRVTTVIPATIDIEFGLTLHAKKAKGLTLNWCIEHPDICDKNGQLMQPFCGDVYVRNNDWKFYLGDTIWAPEYDKVGPWRMYIEHDNKIIVEQTLEVTLEDLEQQNESRFWKRRGF